MVGIVPQSECFHGWEDLLRRRRNYSSKKNPRTLPSASPRKKHFLSLILIVYSLSRLRSIGSLFRTSVLNIGAVCGD
ncbi:hypothetical protein PIB30_031702 [Stylosanthes scabra]|uniref:Uncharacterized protein n=1 Tax=Stylosanthes scabra TaxID=79078 RepID=A0ABU6RC44_9FABA|nr:hypothetical protein [Stylosanthes scabra]